MRRKLSKKQIGAMGLAVMMGVQTPAMAAETSQEAATQETVAQEATQELQTTESQSEEIPVEESQEPETQLQQIGETLSEENEEITEAVV